MIEKIEKISEPGFIEEPPKERPKPEVETTRWDAAEPWDEKTDWK
ncbi:MULTISPECIES: hypothetical protein [Pseudomonas]|nr:MULTISPECIES: hypothetical protein [Pseudomonas]SHJ24550.1 hypothetical protein SAMN05216295_109229 [Pseudomonas zeshuii]